MASQFPTAPNSLRRATQLWGMKLLTPLVARLFARSCDARLEPSPHFEINPIQNAISKPKSSSCANPTRGQVWR
jgi:hypothetical protein